MQHHNEHDDFTSNPLKNKPFCRILEKALSRRTVLSGSMAIAATSFIQPEDAQARSHRFPRRRKLLDFNPVTIAEGTGPTPSISSDYQYDVIIPWGEPIEPDGPDYSYPPNAADQAEQIGIGHDGMTYFPVNYNTSSPNYNWYADNYWSHDRSVNANDGAFVLKQKGMLAINHEFGTTPHVLGKESPESIEDVRAMQHAHGVSIVKIKRKNNGKWKTVRSKNSRRIHVNTPVAFSGPAKDSDLLKTPNGNIPLGTVNNCANGHTPWGTYLTCEENFNGYFGATSREQVWVPTEEQERYGFDDDGFGYGWYNFDRRFDLSDPDYKNEENRFGWVVEIDPFDATQKPVKRTALGRFKHEGVTIVEGRGGRIVAYMGDDQRFDYIYKFVSADNWRTMLAEGKSPLDEGKLYVARFNEDGSGDWLELTIDDPDLAARFSDQAEVLTYARLAADILGATPMDRPEWISVGPRQMVYCTLTNNSQREEADAANPLAPNPDGHIIRWRDRRRHTGTKFNWDIFLIAEDTHDTEDTFSDPDGLYADQDGRLFIETDGTQKDDLNNQLIIADTRTGELRRLFTGVSECEITGITFTPDRRTMFINVQHPGDGDPTLTNFPAQTDGVTVPRDATVVITRKDGGIIGS